MYVPDDKPRAENGASLISRNSILNDTMWDASLSKTIQQIADPEIIFTEID